MTFWLAAAALTIAALLLLLLPLLRRRAAAPVRLDYDLVIYRDQLDEVKKDQDRGLLTAEQAESARTEIQRRMLAAAEIAGATTTIPAEATTARRAGLRLAVAMAILLAVPLGTAALYGRLGWVGMADQPFASRTDKGGHDMAKIDNQLARLLEHLRADPDDVDGWQLLGRSYMSMEKFPEAADALGKAVQHGADDAPTLSSLGEALVFLAAGSVTPAAEANFRGALKSDPSDVASRFYLGLARSQAGDYKAAVAIWNDLVKSGGSDAQWLPQVRQRIADTAKEGGFDPSQVAGKPPVPDTVGLISAAGAASPAPDPKVMVERLAARLKDNPNDAEGWLRLGKAYKVLNDPLRSAEAYGQAARLRPEDPDVLVDYAGALLTKNGNGPLPAEVTTVMRKVLTIAPTNADALFFVGQSEAMAGHKDQARALWTKLRDQLPQGEERTEVEKELDALGK